MANEVLEQLVTSSKQELEVIELVQKLTAQDFENNPSLLTRLIDVCCLFDSYGHILVAASNILLEISAQDRYPQMFDTFVRFLWSTISGDNVNESKNRVFRGIACECLREIELVIPGALEALTAANTRNVNDDRAILETCVIEERSHVYQSYLLLLLTTMQNSQIADNQSKMNAIALGLDSLHLLSPWAKSEALLLISNLLCQNNDQTAFAIMAHKSYESIGFSSKVICLTTLFQLNNFFSCFDMKNKDGNDLFIRQLDLITYHAARDVSNTGRDFVYALRKDYPFDPKLSLCSPFDPIEIQYQATESILHLLSSNSSTIQPESIIQLCWFVEDFWRESKPDIITNTAFKLYLSVLKKFGNFTVIVDQISTLLVQNAILRGGSKFITNITNLLISLENDISVKNKMYISLSEAVVDIQDPLQIPKFFPIFIESLPIKNNDPSRILLALDRFITNLSFDYLVWDNILGFLECVSLGLSIFPPGSPYFLCCHRLVEKIKKN